MLLIDVLTELYNLVLVQILSLVYLNKHLRCYLR